MNRSTARRVLGVSGGAGSEEIDQAFRRSARRLHPDVGGDTQRFQQLVSARRALLGPSSSGSPLIVVRGRPWWRELMHVLTRPVRRGRAEPRVQ
ncbi:MAG: J domain-containing protein [Actinomycetota bacterium]|nr:J domain-containing protein [Actinomycetota bacterium]